MHPAAGVLQSPCRRRREVGTMARCRRIAALLVSAAIVGGVAACTRRPAGPGRTSGAEGGDTQPPLLGAGSGDALADDGAAPEPTIAVEPPGPGVFRLVGIISPHAGYTYSGAIAGWSWDLVGRCGSPPSGATDAAEPPPGTRAFPPQRAGQFYPGEPGVLRDGVERFLAEASPRGDITCDTVRTVVVLSPSHNYPLPKIALLAEDAYRTPLGDVRVDVRLREKLLGELPEDVETNSDAFVGEHAMEVQLPFVQVLHPAVRVLPVIVGASPIDRLERFGAALGRIIREDRSIVIAASSDMSHFYSYDEAVAYDRESSGALERLDLALFDRIGPRREGLCGYCPVRAALAALREVAGWRSRVVPLKYANSGDVTGDLARVVGYGAFALVELIEAGRPHEGRRAPEEVTMYGPEDRRTLLEVAKASVWASIRGQEYEPEPPASELLRRDGAAFVTLKKRGDLRGCIGHVVASMALYRCVAEVARSAATQDYRFDPVRPEEFPELTFEISVLTPPEPVEDPATIEVGRDGLIMSRGSSRGLLLPQVPVEWGWTREEFLDHTCRKAGLPPGAWRDPQTRIERFQAIVWGEDLEDVM